MESRRSRKINTLETINKYNSIKTEDEEENILAYTDFDFSNYIPKNSATTSFEQSKDQFLNLTRKRSRSRSRSPIHQIHPEAEFDIDSHTPTGKSNSTYNKYLKLEGNNITNKNSATTIELLPFSSSVFTTFKPRSPSTIYPENEVIESDSRSKITLKMGLSPRSGKWSPKVSPLATIPAYENDIENNDGIRRSPTFSEISNISFSSTSRIKSTSFDPKYIEKYHKYHSSSSLMVDHPKWDIIDEEAQKKKSALGKNSNYKPLLEKTIESLFQSISQTISLFWVEKIILFIDFLQIYSLMWNISLRWPWTFIWLNFTWGLNIFNIDIFSLCFDVPQGGMFPSLPNYPIYAILVLPFPFIIIGLYESIGYLNHNYLYGYFSLKDISYFKMICTWTLYFLFLPYALFESRIVFCSPKVRSYTNNELNLNLLTYDETTLCHSANHIIAMILCIPGVALYGLYFLFTLRKSVNQLYIYDHPADHEIYIQRKEIEYLTKLSMDWNYSMYWIISSFTLEGVNFWVYSFAMKCFLGILLYFPMNTAGNSIQIFSFSAILFFWVNFGTLVTCFRCTSTNAYFQFFYWCLFIVSVFAMLTGTETQSALTVGTRQTIFLITFCSFGIMLTLISTSVLIWRPYLDTWPTHKTFQQLYNDFQCVEAIDIMQETNDFIVEMHTVPEVLAPVHILEDKMSKLHGIYLVMRKKGSILENTLRSQLDILARLHKEFRNISILPGENNKIVELLSSQTDVILNRSRVRNLMNPRKRNFLFKILAMRLWIGERNIPMTNNLEDALRIDAKVPDENSTAWKQIVLIGSDSNNFTKEEKEEQRKGIETFDNFSYLFGKTEALLENASSRTITEMKLIKQCWKKILRAWERNFEEIEGYKPTLEDKEIKIA